MGFLIGVLWFLLIVSIVVLIGVILLQEGKGGGLAEAFGGAGAETFGVKAAGINKFTALVGTVFLILCIALTKIRTEPTSSALIPGFKPETPQNQPAFPNNIPPPNVPPGGNK